MTSPVSSRSLSAQLLLSIPSNWDGEMRVRSGRITLDEGWAPYCQAELEVQMPPETIKLWNYRAATAAFTSYAEARDSYSYYVEFTDDVESGTPRSDYVDPRLPQTLALVLSQDWVSPVRPGQERTFSLQLRERAFDHAAGTMRIKLESGEGALIDAALVASSASTAALAAFGSLRAIVDMVLALHGAQLEPGDADFDFSGNLQALVWEPGVTAWMFLAPLIQTAALRLFCDELGRWWLVEANNYSINGQINVSAEHNLTRGEDLISRYGDWYDSVVVKYSWDDADGVSLFAYDYAGAPGTKTFVTEWERPYPGSGAAQALLERKVGRGRTLSLEALSDYATTPGMSIVATLPDTPIQTGVVSRVSWLVDAENDSDTMSVDSRGLIDTPVHAWVLAEEGLTWSDIPPGIDWSEYTP